MNVFLMIALVGVIAVAWLWLKPPVLKLKRTTARTWPAPRGKTVAKQKLAPPL